MTHHTEQTLIVNIPAEKIWSILEDYSSVARFAPTIKSSPIVSDIKSGVGAKRRCTFNDGSSLVEEITEYTQGEGFRMDMSEHSMPLKSMQAEMRVKPIDDNSSELYMSADFVVKGGSLGRVVGALVMRPVMKGVFKKVMKGLAYYCETGSQVGEKLPSKEALNNLVLR